MEDGARGYLSSMKLFERHCYLKLLRWRKASNDVNGLNHSCLTCHGSRPCACALLRTVCNGPDACSCAKSSGTANPDKNRQLLNLSRRHLSISPQFDSCPRNTVQLQIG